MLYNPRVYTPITDAGYISSNFSFLLYFDGFAQDCSNSSVLAMELLQSYAKSSI